MRRRTEVNLVKYAFHIVDVFSSTPFGGNQLAVLPDAKQHFDRGHVEDCSRIQFRRNDLRPKPRPFWAGPHRPLGAQFSAFRNHGTRRGRLNSRVPCRGVVTPEIVLGFRSPVIFGQRSAPVAGYRDPARFRPRQRFSPQALPSLLTAERYR